jgi:cytochrome c556
MPVRQLMIGAGVVCLATGCSQGGDPGTLPIAKDATIKDIMKTYVDPAGDFLFQSVQQIADDKGMRQEAPATPSQWAAVRQQLVILSEAPEYLIMRGRQAARPTDKVDFPDVESAPAEVQALIEGSHDDFVKRARRLEDAARSSMAAVDAKDPRALFRSLFGIDHACESCHLHYYYPKDKRAKQAAMDEGLPLD